MKQNNRTLILNLIRQGDFSRAELAKEMKLTKATLSIIADELRSEGLIYDDETIEYSGVGRRPSYLRLNEDSRYLIGIGLTRTGYRMGLFNLGGSAVAVKKYTYVSDDADENLIDIAKNIDELKIKVLPEKILGIGVASPGPVDYREGQILNPPNFEVWHNFKFAQKLSKLTGFRVHVENIANAMALAEQYFGECKKEKNFAYIVVDEGIGSGVVVDGNIYRGDKGYGNELGHTSIKYDGIQCGCGNVGCLECYASIPAILKDTKYSSWQDVLENRDEKIVSLEAEYLSCGIVTLLNLFDLGTIVLGGNICYRESLIAEKISENVNNRAIIRHPVRVILSGAGQEKALAGASIALSQFFF